MSSAKSPAPAPQPSGRTREATPAETEAWPILAGSKPDFARMNPRQRQAYDAWRLPRRFG